MNGWNINIEGTKEVWVYNDPTSGGDYDYGRFVARFKYARPKTNANAFVKFLTKNFTPAEYFARREAGESPLAILESKGYVSPNRRRAERQSRERAQFSARVGF